MSPAPLPALSLRSVQPRRIAECSVVCVRCNDSAEADVDVRIREHGHDRLVVEDRSWRPAALLVTTAVVAWSVVASRGSNLLTASLGPLFLIALAWIAHFRALTTFDRPRGVVRHERHRLGRRVSVEHSLADVASVDLTLPPLSRHFRSWHVQIRLRNGGAFWLSPRPSPRVEPLRAIRDEIGRWLGLPPQVDRVERLRALVRAGARLEAIRLLRAEEGLGLAAARRRLEELLRADPGSDDGS